MAAQMIIMNSKKLTSAPEKKERKRWHPEEDRLLALAVAQETPTHGGTISWHQVASHLPGRSNKDCRKRWHFTLANSIRKGTWLRDEDDRLLQAVETYGTRWSKVAEVVGTRNGDQCSKRWYDCLDPSIDKSPWSPEEDSKLLTLVTRHGRNWSDIVHQHFPNRPPISAKNRYTILRRKQQQQHEQTPSRSSSTKSSSSSSSSTLTPTPSYLAPPSPCFSSSTTAFSSPTPTPSPSGTAYATPEPQMASGAEAACWDYTLGGAGFPSSSSSAISSPQVGSGVELDGLEWTTTAAWVAGGYNEAEFDSLVAPQAQAAGGVVGGYGGGYFGDDGSQMLSLGAAGYGGYENVPGWYENVGLGQETGYVGVGYAHGGGAGIGSW